MQNSCGSLLLPPNPPQGGEKRLFLGLEMGPFLRFFAQESFMHTTLRTTRHGLRPVAAQPSRAWWWWWGGLAQHCCGVVAGSGNGGGCEGNWSALWSRSPRGLHARPVSTLGCVSATVCTHKRARKQVPAGARRSRNGVEGRLPRGGRGGEAGVEATLASCTTADQSLSQTASGVHRASCPLPGSRCRSP